MREGRPIGERLRVALGALFARSKGRLFRKYAATLVALVGAALIINAIIEAYTSYRENRDAISAVQREKALAASQIIEQYLKEIEGQLGWTTHANILSGSVGVDQRRFDFLRLLRQAPAITEVTFLDTDGKEQLKVSRLSMDVAASGADRSGEEPFKQARDKRRYVSPVYFRKESEPYLTLAIAGQGRRSGVTMAEVNLKFIYDVISRLKVGKGGLAYAVDDKGLLIAHPDIGLVLRKTDLSGLEQVKEVLRAGKDASLAPIASVAKDRAGRSVLTASATVATLGWTVFVEQPLSEAFEPLYDSLKRSGLVLLTGLGLAALAGLWLAQRMVVPIQALAAGAAKIGAGDLDHRIEVKTGDEVEKLADSFNAMGGQLKAYYAGLERKVEERTAELAQSLKQQTASAEVLRVISSAPGNTEPVFEKILASARELCDAEYGHLLMYDGRQWTAAALHNLPQAYADFWRKGPVTAGPGTLLGRILETAAPFQREDARLGASYQERGELAVATVELGGVRTLFGVPLLKDGAVIGAIVLYRKEVRLFTDKQVELLQTFADQAVIAIENARLFEAEQTRTKELQESLEYQTATSEVLGVIASSPNDLKPVLETIAAIAAKLCEAEFTILFNVVEKECRVAASNNANAEYVRWLVKHPVALGTASTSGRAALERRTIHVADVLELPADESRRESRQRGGQRTCLSVPLLRHGQAIGVITMMRTQVRSFSSRQVALVETFADQAVIAIENARLFEAEQTRTKELQESLEYQTATSKVLGVISSSPSELQPVLDAIVATAAELCDAEFSFIMRAVDNKGHLVAANNATDEFIKYVQANPVPFDRESVTGRAALDRVTVHVPDVLSDPGFTHREWQKIGKQRSVLGVPLVREGALIGVMILARTRVAPFTDKQIALVETFADQAVIAINNVRLFDEVQARTKELTRSVSEMTALSEVGQAVSSTLDLKTVLGRILSHACEISATSAGAVYVRSGEEDELLLEAGYNMSEELIAAVKKHKIRLDDPIVGECAATGRPKQLPDLDNRRDHPLFDVLRSSGVRAMLAVPLKHQDETIGVLLVRRSYPGEFAADTIKLLQSFASQSSIAINNARLFREIEEKGEQLRIASLHKSQFLANMSHELRTPLNAILGYTELIQDGVYGEPQEKVKSVLDRVQTNGKHLLGLINDVLDLSKIEAGQLVLKLEPYSLADVVQTVVTATESLAAAKKLKLETEVARDLPVGKGDERRLAQVILNLVGNAIKFTDAGSVRIMARTRGKKFTVKVIDTGLGIPATEHQKIFEEFHQVDSSNTKKKGGTGLGLAISKRIVELHGGRISVESEVGKGSTFRIDLPVSVEKQRGV